MTRNLEPCTQDIGDDDHQNAKMLCAWLISQGGKTTKTNRGIASEMGLTESEFYRARNHLQDRDNSDGKPCCGYRAHYRRLGKNSVLALHDPTGEIEAHAHGALANVLGWLVRVHQHHVESERQIEAFEALGDHALGRGDRYGFQLCNRAIVELHEFGTVKPPTLGEMVVWAESLAAD